MLFGIIGHPLTHSFSPSYFNAKFKKLGLLDVSYNMYDLSSIEELPQLLASNDEIVGLNVTLPYKQAVIPYMHELSKEASLIGAVNTIQVKTPLYGSSEKYILKGYNTDVYGFEMSLLSFIPKGDIWALVLGNGGAAKAIIYVLQKLGIRYKLVTRKPQNESELSYAALSKSILHQYRLIINTSPVGMYPETESCPLIPYQFMGSEHFLFDLIYNPEETLFLQKGLKQGAQAKNGFDMLIGQAEKSWEIWTSETGYD